MADERRLPADPEIVAYATQGAFFTVYDCLDIGKVKVEVATYERGQGQTARAVAYLDAADLRPLVHALKAGQFEALFAGRFESFGGSQRQGSVESRILRLEHGYFPQRVLYARRHRSRQRRQLLERIDDGELAEPGRDSDNRQDQADGRHHESRRGRRAQRAGRHQLCGLRRQGRDQGDSPPEHNHAL